MSTLQPTGRGIFARHDTAFGWTLRIVSLGIVLALWQWYGRLGESFAIAPVSEVAKALWTGLTEGDFLRATAGTLLTMAVGYVIAVVIGVSVGLFIGVSSYARNTLEPLVHAAYATPISLLIPVIGIYTGLDFRGRVTLTVLWCVFEILVATTTGVREAPTSLISVARSFTAPRTMIYRTIILPAALPYVALGLRIGVARAMRGAVTAELLLSAVNLGKILTHAGSTFDIPTLLAGIIFVMLLGLVLMYLAEGIEKRATRHRAA
ncbi:MAG: ABC transporter permease subunit [Streptosporangiales bacterium]|nr:ABC transporter permease subunit [Streptosporangiales bacterium]